MHHKSWTLKSKAIKNAIKLAANFHSKGVLEVISKEFNQGTSRREEVAVKE